MPPKKRSIKLEDIEHRGRVTISRFRDLDSPAASVARVPKRTEPTAAAKPAASGRYTPPLKSIRFRPGWHKAVGFAFILAGLAVIIVNYAMQGSDLRLLPGGHLEVYFVLGLAIALCSMWWFGWFDRES